MKRSGKFYRKNEASVMKQLGLEPTPNSGSGWITKEDGQSENVICQLKSTDAASIKVNKKDLDVLQYNANTAHKLPVFAIQFLQSDEVYLIMSPEVLQEAAQYLGTGCLPNENMFGIDMNVEDTSPLEIKQPIKSNSNIREEFSQYNEEKFKKKRKSAT